jgi:hypothetical protein
MEAEFDGCVLFTFVLVDTCSCRLVAKYEPFDIVTRKALEHAAADASAKLSSSAVKAVMEAYFKLPGFDDAASSWKELSNISGLGLWIFSNGTREVSVPFG